MAIALAEADKYEVLEKIGKGLCATYMIYHRDHHIDDDRLGCGSFGIIRKVKRKTDSFVRRIDNPSIITDPYKRTLTDTMPERNQLHQDVSKGKGAADG